MSAGARSSAVAPHRHVVRFYDRDDELADDVGSHLRRALAADEAVIVVAGPAHRRAFEERMAGCDLAAARAACRFISLDAAQTMDRFMTGAQPDPDRFGQVIGGVIRQAAGAGRPVHVYGEMVALLWDAGQLSAALELESRWNELGERLPFSLTCGYPSQAVTGDEHAEALEAVCRLHAVVGGPDEAARSFPMAYGSPRAARHFVVQALRLWGQAARCDDAALIAAELAANAVVHGRSDFTIAVSRSAAGIRISVSDDSPVPAGSEGSLLVPAAGHGLSLVAAVARRWAAEPLAAGKLVWAEI